MKPDVSLIVAVQRHQTGANVHTLNNLLARYVLACSANHSAMAESAKQDLIVTLVENERKRLVPPFLGPLPPG